MAKADITKNKELIKKESRLNELSKKILATIDPSYTDRQILTGRDAELQAVIQDEINLSKGISGGSIVDFVSSLDIQSFDNSMNPNNPPDRIVRGEQYLDNDELFTRNIGDIFGYFQDIYKNRYLEVADLKFISKFIPAIGEAVATTLDAIVTSDDISSTISRNLVFSPSLTDSEKNMAESEIIRIEKEYKLHKKLKNIVYKRALITGSFYVYHISYKDLFEKVSSMKAEGKFNTPFIGLLNSSSSQQNAQRQKSGYHSQNGRATEGATDDVTFRSESPLIDASQLSVVLESCGIEKTSIKKLVNEIEPQFGSFVVNNDADILYDALMEAVSVDEGIVNGIASGYSELFKSSADIEYMIDGTMDEKEAKKQKKRKEKYDTNGTYLKYIDAKNIIPLKVYNQVLGYYHVHTTPRRKNGPMSQPGNITSSSISGIASSVFSSASISQKKQEDAIASIVDTISNGIIEKFSAKFVQNNPAFRDLIADCLIANGLIDNDFNIQFIPANQIVPFIINEDEYGNGESILANSLFPAKMLLSLIVSKMLNYMNNSGSTTIAHIKKGPIDLATNNQVQRVIRNMTESRINFNDLISSNMVFSKFTRNGRMQIPTSKDGNHLVDFEIQDGQQIDMNPEFENWLEKNAIMGTGVPSVIMDYINSADFAKSYTTSNIKFAGRVSSYDSDLEDPTTTLYKHLIMNSGLDENLKRKIVNGFEFKLPRPKVLTNSNNNEFLSTLLSTAQSVANIELGENTGDDDADKPAIKDAFIKGYVTVNAPFIDWAATDQILKNAKLTVAENKKVKPDAIPTDNTEPPMDMGSSDDEY